MTKAFAHLRATGRTTRMLEHTPMMSPFLNAERKAAAKKMGWLIHKRVP